MTGKIVVMGASGAIGTAICSYFHSARYSVIGVGRSPAPISHPSTSWICWNVGRGRPAFEHLAKSSVSAVVFAQGMNLNDSIYSFDQEKHEALYRANVGYILESLNVLLSLEVLEDGARLCIISSIWQNLGRPNKLSYCVTKAALQGLVQSLAIDLGTRNMLVNAILPGALDTPMTRANLSAEQIHKLEGMSPLNSLPEMQDVCNLVEFLASDRNTGITGQFIAVDKGLSYAKFV